MWTLQRGAAPQVSSARAWQGCFFPTHIAPESPWKPPGTLALASEHWQPQAPNLIHCCSQDLPPSGCNILSPQAEKWLMAQTIAAVPRVMADINWALTGLRKCCTRNLHGALTHGILNTCVVGAFNLPILLMRSLSWEKWKRMVIRQNQKCRI